MPATVRKMRHVLEALALARATVEKERDRLVTFQAEQGINRETPVGARIAGKLEAFDAAIRIVERVGA